MGRGIQNAVLTVSVCRQAAPDWVSRDARKRRPSYGAGVGMATGSQQSVDPHVSLPRHRQKDAHHEPLAITTLRVDRGDLSRCRLLDGPPMARCSWRAASTASLLRWPPPSGTTPGPGPDMPLTSETCPRTAGGHRMRSSLLAEPLARRLQKSPTRWQHRDEALRVSVDCRPADRRPRRRYPWSMRR
jgi:hypothetical protein